MTTTKRQTPAEGKAYGASGTVLTFLESHEHLSIQELIPKLNLLIVQVLTETSNGELEEMLGMILLCNSYVSHSYFVLIILSFCP